MAKILIVEDEKILSDMYRQKFIRSGFHIKVVGEAKKALSLIRKEGFDLIVLDLMLPQEDGTFFLEKLREMPNGPSVPVLVFTNLDTVEMRRRCQELNAVDYIIKAQYTPQQLIDKVNKILGTGKNGKNTNRKSTHLHK